MSVVLSICSYKKAPSCIVGHIPMLGYYEVKADSIDDFAIPGLYISHMGTLSIIHEAIHLANMHQLVITPADLQFFDLKTNAWSDTGYGEYEDETTCIMFESSKLLAVITQLISVKDYIISQMEAAGKGADVKQMEDHEEVAFLHTFKTLLETAVKEDAMVRISLN